MLIKHLRDDFGTPFATVVATGPNEIGVSVCNTKDHFNKKMGIKVAEGRSRMRSMDISFVPSQAVLYNLTTRPIVDIIDNEVKRMHLRAQKYFKVIA